MVSLLWLLLLLLSQRGDAGKGRGGGCKVRRVWVVFGEDGGGNERGGGGLEHAVD